jgi:hypothetical protein
MAKTAVRKMRAEGWARSGFTDVDLNTLKKARLLPKAAEMVIPSDEIIPCPDDGFRVLFLSFIYRGLSLPAHEFLHGLHFVYDVQLHQLTPNSILHIACFITLVGDHTTQNKKILALRPRSSLQGEVTDRIP